MSSANHGREVGPIEARMIQRASEVRARLLMGRRLKPLELPTPQIEEAADSATPTDMAPEAAAILDYLVFPPLPRTGALKWRDIVDEVCTKHNVSVTEICGELRARGVVAARYEVFYRLSKETGMSLSQIGRHVGDRDHTTVLYGVRKHLARVGEDSDQ